MSQHLPEFPPVEVLHRCVPFARWLTPSVVSFLLSAASGDIHLVLLLCLLGLLWLTGTSVAIPVRGQSLNTARRNNRDLPFISTSPSVSILRFSAYPIFFSSFRRFLELMAAFGPLVGSRPGRAPRFASALVMPLPGPDFLLFAFLSLAARAMSRLREGPFGFFTEGILRQICDWHVA